MSDIKVDTNKLRYYAQRLNNVNYRLRNIDADLDRLYLKIDITDIVKLLKADLSIGYNDKLRKCRDYLNLTADDFEMVEKTLTSRNVMVRKPAYTRSTVFSLLKHLFMSVNTSVTKVGRAKKANITDVAGLLSFSAVYETKIKYSKRIIKLIKACMDTIRSVIFDKETIENNESTIKEEIIENEGLHVGEKADGVNVAAKREEKSFDLNDNNAVDADNGKSQNAKQRINTYFNSVQGVDLGGKEYNYKKDGAVKAWQCHAFVNEAWKNIYGYDTYDRECRRTEKQFDFDNLSSYVKSNAEIGDIIRFDNDSKNYSYQHSMLIEDISDTGITVCEYGGARHSYKEGPVKETYTWEELQLKWETKGNYYFLYKLEVS